VRQHSELQPAVQVAPSDARMPPRPPPLPRAQLRVAGIVLEPVNAFFEQIFETGVDEMSWDDLSKNEMDWPSVREVRCSRQGSIAQRSAIQLSEAQCSAV
jgi:hypothetical protein